MKESTDELYSMGEASSNSGPIQFSDDDDDDKMKAILMFLYKCIISTIRK